MAGLCTGVDKIVGFALTHHLKHNITESSNKEAKIVLSSNRLRVLSMFLFTSSPKRT